MEKDLEHALDEQALGTVTGGGPGSGGGSPEFAVGEIVKVEKEDLSGSSLGRVVDYYYAGGCGIVYGVELGHFAEDGVTFVVTQSSADYYAAYLHHRY